jgi:hypothetical protein
MFEKQIKAGMRFLDKTNPGWWDKINLRILNLGDCVKCVLGQLQGDEPAATYDATRLSHTHFSGFQRDHNLIFADTDRMGFSASLELVCSVDACYRILTKEWKEAIKKRRADVRAKNSAGRSLPR